jgi:hypothetical protein
MILLYFCLWYAICFISCLFHEFGHYITSKYFGWKVSNFQIRWYCEENITIMIPITDRCSWNYFLVCISGPIVGLLTTLLSLHYVQIPYYMQFFCLLSDLYNFLPFVQGSDSNICLSIITAKTISHSLPKFNIMAQLQSITYTIIYFWTFIFFIFDY